MSSRQLRKLQKQRELQQEAAREERIGEDDEAEESEDEPVPITRPKVNLFAALNDGDDDDDDADAEDDKDEDDEQPIPEPITSEPNPAGSAKKNKKKKKKKNKKKAATAADDVLAAGDANNSDEDEIDKAIKELKISSTAAGGRGSAAQDEDRQRRAIASNTLLQINPYHLKAIHEMRNLFGREVIESANAEEEQQQQQQTRRGGRRRQVQQQQLDLETYLRSQAPNAKKLPEVSLRRNIFIQGRDYWPAQSAGGLTMKEMGKSEDGTATEYAYVHDGEYDSLQMLFFGCVQIGDPMRMVHLLKKVRKYFTPIPPPLLSPLFPKTNIFASAYHVSTLLQVSFVAKQDQNMALSSELCERALFTFGRVTTSAFRQHVEQGRARLDFRRPENRQFWLAGYHYLRSLLRKGTFRTALEWAKLLYALDPQDPYAMRHYLHFLAVRAYESKWLLDFLEDVEENATHQEQQQQQQQQHEDFVYVKQSGILARLQMDDVDGARKDLEAGIKRVPWLYCALFQELGLDAPPSIWGVHAETDARRFWVALYIHFAKDLWNNTQATALLTEVAKGMEKKVSVADLPKDDNVPDLGATRLAYLEGQTNLITLAPRALLERQPNYEFDPLPPAEEENIFTKQGTRLPWLERRHAAAGRGGATAEEEEDPQVREALARMQNILAAQGGAGGAGVGRPVRGFGVAGGGPGDMDGESDYDDETDEELRRDLEEHARRSNEPGFLGQLMQMLGMRGGAGAAEAQEEGEGEGEEEEEWERYEDFEEGGAREGEEDDDVPGAWPGQEERR